MRRVTINDVAREAGVSRQTVSRVINAKGEVSPETREHVLSVIQQLGYRPNRLAQGMVTQRTGTVGLEVADVTNPFFAEVVRGAQQFALQKEYNLFLINSEDDPRLALESLSTLMAQGTDGLIGFMGHVRDGDLADFADSYRPLVLINRHVDHPNVSSVGVDLYGGAMLAVSYLLERGHRAIGMLANRGAVLHGSRRFCGYRDALERHGEPFRRDWLVEADLTLQGGYEAARYLLSSQPALTALFTYNDLMAIGALRACRDLGRRVGADCAVVGFDDIPLASMVTPSLTTVSYDKYAMGQRAMQRVCEMLEHPSEKLPPVELELHLIPRESTEAIS